VGREYPAADLKPALVDKNAVPIYDVDVRVLLKITGHIVDRAGE